MSSRLMALAILLSCACFLSAAEPQVKEVTDALGKLQITMPEGSGEAKFSQEEIAPNITYLYRFTFKDGTEGIVISTKIRPDLPKTDAILERQIPRYEKMRGIWSKEGFWFEMKGKAPNRMFESVIVNVEGGDTYPLALAREESAKELKSVGVSQFFVLDRRYFEVAVFVPQAGKLDKDALAKKAVDYCTQWRTGISVK